MLAVLSVWPFVYFIIFIGFMFVSFANVGSSSAHNAQAFDAFKYIFVVHLLTMVLMFALTAAYVVHAFRSDELDQDKRTLWVIVLFFGNMLAFPIYWWLYVRPSRRTNATGATDDSRVQAAP